jgi:hypothetical protein
MAVPATCPFDGLQIASQPNSGVTVIAGQLADQAALHGLFANRSFLEEGPC